MLTGAGKGFFGHQDITAARSLRAGFADCVQSAMVMTRIEVLKEAIQEADIDGRRQEVTEMATLAVAILQGASIATDKPHHAAAPRSWFLNLENLFERALRASVSIMLEGQAQVTGPVDRPPLFQTFPGRFQANPDVVVRGALGTVLLDAKYKDFEGWPSTSDLHELLAHAASYNAVKAALFYPSQADWETRHLGVSATGCDVWVFTVPFDDLQGAIATSLASLGFRSVLGRMPLAA